MNIRPLDIAWVLLKDNRGDILERVLSIIESPANRDMSDEELASGWEQLLQEVGDMYDISPHDVDRALGTHFITDEGSDFEQNHPARAPWTTPLVDEIKWQLVEALHDKLDTGLHLNAEPSQYWRQEAERQGRQGQQQDDDDPGGTPPVCEECEDNHDVSYGGRDPDTGEALYVCTYEGHDDSDFEHLYDDNGHLWMDSEGYLTTPMTPQEPPDADEMARLFSEPRTMTERGMRRYENQRGEPVPHESIRGLAAPLTAASQGEGRVGPDVMDENQLIRYEAPQLREMIRRIGEELTRRGYGDRYQGVTE